LPTTAAFLIPSSPWLEPIPPLFSSSTAVPLPDQVVPSPLPPSSSGGPSGLCGSAGPGPPCRPPNSSRISSIRTSF
jgi:hypothetical protein